jgi:uncharacterized protein YhaN
MSEVNTHVVENATHGVEPDPIVAQPESSAIPQAFDDTPPAAWRERAAKAEKRSAALESQIKEFEESLASVRSQLEEERRARAIDAELHKADPIDADTVRMLIEVSMPDKTNADVAKVVGDLKKRKPFLFREAPRRSAYGAFAERDVDESRSLAEEARLTGDRNALLRYLRARRGV